ncbi:MAG: mannitol dehydrogenase family protein [Gammaproteobacteria bacterium]|nr:mannitol dehydrogenase family protein [Gammaproteobacteria bacterium]
MQSRLTESSLQRLDFARRPVYSRGDISPGILHIGFGGFHRAHQAVYTEDILDSGDHRWGIIGASLRSTTMRSRLAPQDFLYTLCTRHADHNEYRVIGGIKDVLTLSQHQQQLLELIASPKIQIITLTITEKGYCLTSGGELDEAHPDIQKDLGNPYFPISAPGLLARGLKYRMEAGSGPISIISCDNLSRNGRSTRQAVTGVAGLFSAENASWIRDYVSFPDTMVDRIVPATSELDTAGFERETGMEDSGLVICEPFSQWVIESNIAGERPEWERVGVQFVDDVAVYEEIKLRLLNASHSALAYLGLLAGYEYIHEAMADPLLARFTEYLMEKEISPLIQPPIGFDLKQYTQSILKRFANPAIQYRTAQVANDGSLKLQQRIYPTLTEYLQMSVGAPGLVLVVAAWLHCLTTPAYASLFSDPGGEYIRSYSGDNLPQLLTSESETLGMIWGDEAFKGQIRAVADDLKRNNIHPMLQRAMGSD